MANNIVTKAVVASVNVGEFAWSGGQGVMSADATWSGGNVALQMRNMASGTWVTVPSAVSLTANGSILFWAPEGSLQVIVTTATNVNVTVSGLSLV